MLKLYPHLAYISGSRYLFYPYLCLTYYLLLVYFNGARQTKILVGSVLALAFVIHLPKFQTKSIDYKWKEHLEFERNNKCNARIPIPYSGVEGVAWNYQTKYNDARICSNRPISKWVG